MISSLSIVKIPFLGLWDYKERSHTIIKKTPKIWAMSELIGNRIDQQDQQDVVQLLPDPTPKLQREINSC